jgi:Tfp pilus assembly protein PilO
MATAQGEELSGLKQRLASMQRIVESFDTYVPAESSLGTFLQRIAGIMTECHLTDQVVLPGKEWETSNVNGIPIHITCKGTLTDVFDFFSRLEALDRLVRIEKVALVNDNNLMGLVSMQTEAVIFYQSPKQRKASGAAADEAAGGSDNGT